MDNGGIKDTMKSHLDHVQSVVRANPKKWAGIAAGAGLGLGVILRMMRHRAPALPHLVVIDRNAEESSRAG